MNFFKRYWYLIIVTILTIGIGVVAYFTSIKLEQKNSVAPTVPQETPKAVNETNCKLVVSFMATPTLTPSATPTGVFDSPTPTPTATNTPTPTPTPIGYTPICTDLTLSPASGTPPFTTTLTCTGTITNGEITAVEFTLPDGTTKVVEENVGNPGSISFDYTVSQSGTVSFSCRVRDNNGNFSLTSDACRKSIGPTPTAGPSPTAGPTATPPTPQIPVAGSGPSVLGAATIAGGILLLLLGFAF